jgi:hypothetical protein
MSLLLLVRASFHPPHRGGYYYGVAAAARSSACSSWLSQVSSFSSSSSQNNNNKKTTIITKDVSNKNITNEEVFERTVYVHPLSQIILEYFQESKADWIIERGLERRLTLHRDGSFELSLAANKTPEQQNHPQNHPQNHQHPHPQRIWTSYDEQEKKHWLTVQKGSLHERYLLQDNLLSAWQANRNTSLMERIHVAVEDMIRAIDNTTSTEENGDAPKE